MLLRPLRLLPLTTHLSRTIRPFSATALQLAEGDTGSVRQGGQRSGDTWSRREKALEDMYIKEREKEIIAMLREKIAAQVKALDKDRLMLNQMEDHFGHVAEEGNVADEWSRKY
jgi:hypothetical protein